MSVQKRAVVVESKYHSSQHKVQLIDDTCTHVIRIMTSHNPHNDTIVF